MSIGYTKLDWYNKCIREEAKVQICNILFNSFKSVLLLTRLTISVQGT